MVNHPNVVRILDYGTAEAEQNPYIVMEYLKGRSLRFLIARGDVPLANRLRILAQVADALTAIHAAHICHRDIKPSNILVDEHLVAKLTDFGVARLPESDLTLTTSFVGSPAYMAPEAYVSARVDHRADLFSLGVVSYEFLVGTKPFTGENLPQMMNAIRHQAPPLPHSLVPRFPPDLERLLMAMLEKDPRQRPQAAETVAAQFREVLARLGG
jgi:serine/threonine-protein kinase